MMTRHTRLCPIRISLNIMLLCVIAIATGCREQEPLPSHHFDVGQDQTVLLPTASAWVNPKVTDGRADWVEMREPDFSEVQADDSKALAMQDDGNAAAVTGGSEIEAELRDLIAEYNDLVDDEKFDDVIEFYIPDQGDTVEKMIKAIPAMTDKFKELQAVLPESSEQLDTMLAAFTLKKELRLDVDQINVISEKMATGNLKDTPETASLPASLKQIRFTYDGEYWFIDVPVLNLAKMMLPMLDQSKSGVDELVAGIKSGDITGDEITTKVAEMAGLFSQTEIAKDNADDKEDSDEDTED